MIPDYAGRVAVITGAARGLGRALAEELAYRRCHLALIDVDADALSTTQRELARPGILVTQHSADVGCQPGLQHVADEVARAHGSVHLLINNAGISASTSFSNATLEDFQKIIRINFFGVVHGCRAFLKLLEKHSEGQILNVSSCFAWVGCPRKTAYSASKAAIRAFSESLRSELAKTGVGVTQLYPGPLHTNIVRDGTSDSEHQRSREDAFLSSRGIPLEVVARRCLDQLRSNPSRIVIGFDYRCIDLLARLSPAFAGRVMQFGVERAGI
jgi:short-subunit dehydrogenase